VTDGLLDVNIPPFDDGLYAAVRKDADVIYVELFERI